MLLSHLPTILNNLQPVCIVLNTQSEDSNSGAQESALYRAVQPVIRCVPYGTLIVLPEICAHRCTARNAAVRVVQQLLEVFTQGSHFESNFEFRSTWQLDTSPTQNSKCARNLLEMLRSTGFKYSRNAAC